MRSVPIRSLRRMDAWLPKDGCFPDPDRGTGSRLCRLEWAFIMTRRLSQGQQTYSPGSRPKLASVGSWRMYLLIITSLFNPAVVGCLPNGCDVRDWIRYWSRYHVMPMSYPCCACTG